MDRSAKGIVVFAAAYFALFVALEWYINRIYSPGTAFYSSPAFGGAIVLYIVVVAFVLLRYKNKGSRQK